MKVLWLPEGPQKVEKAEIIDFSSKFFMASLRKSGGDPSALQLQRMQCDIE